MNILFTLHNFLPEAVFGAEQVCIQQMRELLRRGHRVGVFYAANRMVTEQQLEAQGLLGLECFPISFLNTKGQVLLSVFKPRVTRRFEQVLAQFRPDAVVYHHLVRLSLDLPVVSHRKKIPSLLYLHDFYMICPSYSLMRPDYRICSGPGIFKCPACLFESRFQRMKSFSRAAAIPVVPLMMLRQQMVRRLLRGVAAVISPSRFLAQALASYGFTPSPVHIIANGCEPAARETITGGTGVDGLRFGYLGSIIPKKGIDLLVDAFAGELGERLTIRGFHDQAAIDRFRQQHPDFRGTLERFNPDKATFFNNVDVVIVPSLWYENQPTVVIEAFSYGKPLICSDCGALPEMVADRVSGLLFKTGDADDLRKKVRHLIDDPTALDRLVAGIPRWPSISENVDRLIECVPK